MTLPEPCPNWALFLDFDGTIVDIAETPEAVIVPEALPSLLAALRETFGNAVAIVTGRPTGEIDRLLGEVVPAVAGLHGLERRAADGVVVRPPLPHEGLQGLRTMLRDFSAAHPDVLIEDKERAIALHYRRAPSLGDACRDLLRRALQRNMDGWEMLEGKFVLEVRPRGVTKGSAIEAFMNEAPFLGRTPVFCGDDTTDEDGFAAVNLRGGVSIHVGDRPDTLATARIRSVAELLDWLTQVAGMRRGSC